VQTYAYNAEPLHVKHQTTDDNLLYDSSEAEDSTLCSFSPITSVRNPSFGLVKYRTDDSIAEQLRTAFVNIEPYWPELSTVELPTNIYYGSDSWPMLDHLPCLYRTPRPIHDDLLPFFLSYHRENINYGRYFWYCDHHRFIKESLFDLAKQSNLLQYAIAAFSALIYSNQADYHMRKFTFLFYAKAIQELQQVINTDSMDSEASVYTTVATILVLASVEARPCTKSLMIAGYCRFGQMFWTCERRSPNLANAYYCHSTLFICPRS
jgi:Fungal specific transcription factor domain